MTKQTLLTREHFIQFVMGKIEEIWPNALVEQGKTDMDYTIKQSEEDAMAVGIYLGNLWSNYQRTNDLNTIMDYLNIQINVNANIEEMAKTLNIDAVFPAFRRAGFSKLENTIPEDMKDKEEVWMIQDDFSDALEVVYIEDSERFVSFVSSNRLPKGMTEDELSDIAYANLKKQGWVAPVDSIDIGEYATLHIFHNPNLPYQGQFGVREMFEPHLGDYFLFAIPTREYSVAVQFKKDPDTFLAMATDMAVRLKHMATAMNQKELNPLSDIVHRVSIADGVKVIG